ncbi:phosphoglycerate dehydrogenase protein [Rutstroemia sp. NJR-2017a WRK4]|nr:phosphoglycerate dehydrogenase protein [Rutstroemia sp. NJR-2017a WRK4]
MAPSAIPPPTTSESTPDTRPKILIPEKVSPDGLALLTPHFQIDQRTSLSASDLLSLIPSYTALIIRSETKVTSAVLQAAHSLKVVARAGVGVDNIDIDAATKHGIIVVNSPSGNIAAAAEHTIALMMAVARNVCAGDRGLREGGWERGKLVGREVGGKVLGIVGLGKVGVKVARMGVGLGMKVVAVDPYASAEVAAGLGVQLVGNLKDMLGTVDFLTVHTPLIASTMDMIGKEELQMMKKTAMVLNVARGGVYNEDALLEALDTGVIAGAGLDVFTSEPPVEGSAAWKLARHSRVVATPHLGASTVEAQESVSVDVCTQVRAILLGGMPTSAVNAPLILPEEYKKLQPFVRLLEKMGSLYTQHYGGKSGAGGIGGGRKFEIVYEGELAGMTNTRPLFAALVKGLLGSISERGGRDVNIVNAGGLARERGIVVSETRSGGGGGVGGSGSLVTLRVDGGEGREEQVISGFVSGRGVWISRLDRFRTSFAPEGTLCVLRNNDEPGKIGVVGGILGRHGINIRFMSVAALEKDEDGDDSQGEGNAKDRVEGELKNEALMILGVDGVVGKEVEAELRGATGIFDVSIVVL